MPLITNLCIILLIFSKREVMKLLLILLFLAKFLFSNEIIQIKNRNINSINNIINIFQKRLDCIKDKDPKECIKEFPYNQKSDKLAILICNSFPKAYYKNILKRDIKILQKEKSCWQQATNIDDVKKCIKN